MCELISFLFVASRISVDVFTFSQYNAKLHILYLNCLKIIKLVPYIPDCFNIYLIYI